MQHVESLDVYQMKASETYLPTPIDHIATYLLLGLLSEAGEFASKWKKLFRDGDGQMTPELRLALILELGDVLWYTSVLASELGADLSEVAALNLDKLGERARRNKIRGNGDNR